MYFVIGVDDSSFSSRSLAALPLPFFHSLFLSPSPSMWDEEVNFCPCNYYLCMHASILSLFSSSFFCGYFYFSAKRTRAIANVLVRISVAIFLYESFAVLHWLTKHRLVVVFIFVVVVVIINMWLFNSKSYRASIYQTRKMETRSRFIHLIDGVIAAIVVVVNVAVQFGCVRIHVLNLLTYSAYIVMI